MRPCWSKIAANTPTVGMASPWSVPNRRAANSLLLIALAQSQMGGLEGEALQEATILYSRGRRAWQLASEPAGQRRDGARAAVHQQDTALRLALVLRGPIQPAGDRGVVGAPVVGHVARAGNNRNRIGGVYAVGEAEVRPAGDAGCLDNQFLGLAQLGGRAVEADPVEIGMRQRVVRDLVALADDRARRVGVGHDPAAGHEEGAMQAV